MQTTASRKTAHTLTPETLCAIVAEKITAQLTKLQSQAPYPMHPLMLVITLRTLINEKAQAKKIELDGFDDGRNAIDATLERTLLNGADANSNPALTKISQLLSIFFDTLATNTARDSDADQAFIKTTTTTLVNTLYANLGTQKFPSLCGAYLAFIHHNQLTGKCADRVALATHVVQAGIDTGGCMTHAADTSDHDVLEILAGDPNFAHQASHYFEQHHSDPCKAPSCQALAQAFIGTLPKQDNAAPTQQPGIRPMPIPTLHEKLDVLCDNIDDYALGEFLQAFAEQFGEASLIPSVATGAAPASAQITTTTTMPMPDLADTTDTAAQASEQHIAIYRNLEIIIEYLLNVPTTQSPAHEAQYRARLAMAFLLSMDTTLPGYNDWVTRLIEKINPALAGAKVLRYADLTSALTHYFARISLATSSATPNAHGDDNSHGDTHTTASGNSDASSSRSNSDDNSSDDDTTDADTDSDDAEQAAKGKAKLDLDADATHNTTATPPQPTTGTGTAEVQVTLTPTASIDEHAMAQVPAALCHLYLRAPTLSIDTFTLLMRLPAVADFLKHHFGADTLVLHEQLIMQPHATPGQPFAVGQELRWLQAYSEHIATHPANRDASANTTDDATTLEQCIQHCLAQTLIGSPSNTLFALANQGNLAAMHELYYLCVNPTATDTAQATWFSPALTLLFAHCQNLVASDSAALRDQGVTWFIELSQNNTQQAKQCLTSIVEQVLAQPSLTQTAQGKSMTQAALTLILSLYHNDTLSAFEVMQLTALRSNDGIFFWQAIALFAKFNATVGSAYYKHILTLAFTQDQTITALCQYAIKEAPFFAIVLMPMLAQQNGDITPEQAQAYIQRVFDSILRESANIEYPLPAISILLATTTLLLIENPTLDATTLLAKPRPAPTPTAASAAGSAADATAPPLAGAKALLETPLMRPPHGKRHYVETHNAGQIWDKKILNVTRFNHRNLPQTVERTINPFEAFIMLYRLYRLLLQLNPEKPRFNAPEAHQLSLDHFKYVLVQLARHTVRRTGKINVASLREAMNTRIRSLCDARYRDALKQLENCGGDDLLLALDLFIVFLRTTQHLGNAHEQTLATSLCVFATFNPQSLNRLVELNAADDACLLASWRLRETTPGRGQRTPADVALASPTPNSRLIQHLNEYDIHFKIDTLVDRVIAISETSDNNARAQAITAYLAPLRTLIVGASLNQFTHCCRLRYEHYEQHNSHNVFQSWVDNAAKSQSPLYTLYHGRLTSKTQRHCLQRLHTPLNVWLQQPRRHLPRVIAPGGGGSAAAAGSAAAPSRPRP